MDKIFGSFVAFNDIYGATLFKYSITLFKILNDVATYRLLNLWNTNLYYENQSIFKVLFVNNLD